MSSSRTSFVSSILVVAVSVIAVTVAIRHVRAEVDTSPLLQQAMDTSPLLQQAMRFRVAVHKRRSGASIPIYHCRQAREGCDRRLTEFAHYLIDAGEKNGIDPWLLAAMAFRESGMNPFAVGAVGELGILQLHPKNPKVKSVRFVRDQYYRQRCRKQPGACQREVVDRAAEILARSLAMCGGDLYLALGAYNTGKCGGNRTYADRIIVERDALKNAVGLL
jgi:soluble lytic murein transglycosylase-like protein